MRSPSRRPALCSARASRPQLTEPRCWPTARAPAPPSPSLTPAGAHCAGGSRPHHAAHVQCGGAAGHARRSGRDQRTPILYGCVSPCVCCARAVCAVRVRVCACAHRKVMGCWHVCRLRAATDAPKPAAPAPVAGSPDTNLLRLAPGCAPFNRPVLTCAACLPAALGARKRCTRMALLPAQASSGRACTINRRPTCRAWSTSWTRRTLRGSMRTWAWGAAARAGGGRAPRRRTQTSSVRALRLGGMLRVL